MNELRFLCPNWHRLSETERRRLERSLQDLRARLRRYMEQETELTNQIKEIISSNNISLESFLLRAEKHILTKVADLCTEGDGFNIEDLVTVINKTQTISEAICQTICAIRPESSPCTGTCAKYKK